jgi:predicted Zn-dependent protease
MRRYGFALVLALGLAACTTSPTGRPQLMLVPESFAIESSAQAYKQQLMPYARQRRLDSNPETTQRVREITGRLVAQAVRMRPDTRSWDWQVVVIDDPTTVNAWAMAGGKIAVYSGLLREIRPTDDELAQVLGHEIAHAVAAHSAEQMSVAMATQLGVTALAIATDSAAAAGVGAAAATLAVGLPYSRQAETEADRIGIELAAKAGYDPRAAVSLWEKMEREAGGGAPPEFLSTHPAPANRTAALAELVPQMQPYYQSAKQSNPPAHPL